MLNSTDHHTPIKYRPDIDGLRALAVCAVVAFHAFPKSIKGGFIGVDIFFVISGYLISSIIFKNLDENNFSFLDFYARRTKRIFPALLLVLICCLIYEYFKLLPSELAVFGKHVFSGSVFISNFTLWKESGYFDSAVNTKPLLHLWSLAIEEQFYIIWPIIIFVTWKVKKAVLPLILTLILISFSANIFFLKEQISTVFYFPQFRFWEILFGTLLAYLTRYLPQSFLVNRDSRLANYRSVIGSILILLGFIIVNHQSAFPGWWALLPVVGTFLIISSGDQAWINNKILANKKMVSIGLISYPLYLWHWPLLSFLEIYYGRYPSQVPRIIAVIVSFGLAWLTVNYLEKPLRTSWKKFGQVKVLAPAMGLLGLLGLYIQNQNGFPNRFPIEIRELASITNPYEFFNYQKQTRTGICHSPDKSVSLKVKEKNCVENIKPLIMLMGDSYVNHLYPGFISIQGSKKLFGIAQFTNGNGIPFINQGDDKIVETTRKLNDVMKENFQIIRKYQPAFVVMSWMYNNANKLSIPDSQKAIVETINEIKKESPKTKIVVIGPVPHWDLNLNIVYVKYWLKYRKMIPEYSDYKLNKRFIEWDQALKAPIEASGATYVSAYGILCKNEKCLTRVGPTNQDLSSIDWGHLSASSSRYLVQRIQSIFIGPKIKLRE